MLCCAGAKGGERADRTQVQRVRRAARDARATPDARPLRTGVHFGARHPHEGSYASSRTSTRTRTVPCPFFVFLFSAVLFYEEFAHLWLHRIIS